MTKRREHAAAPWSNEKAARRTHTRDLGWATEWIGKLHSSCHPKQLGFVEDPCKRLTVLSSRGGGKTTAGMAKLLETMGAPLITKPDKPGVPCLFVALTREQAVDLIWVHLKDVLDRLHVDAGFGEVKRVCTLGANGSTLRLVGADDRKEIEKLRGQPFAGVVIDEAASHNAKLLENLIKQIIAPRLGELAGWLALTGTPGHELNGLFYEATRPGSAEHRPYDERVDGEKRPKWSSHNWSLQDGAPYVPAIKLLWDQALIDKETEGWSDTHPIWLREYCAKWAADDTDNVFKYRPHDEAGKPFNQWDPERVGAFKLGKLPDGFDDWEHVIALDKGFTDAFAVNVFAFSPTDPSKKLRHRYGFEATEFYARKLAELLLGEELKTDEPGGLVGEIGWPVGLVGDIDDAFLAEMANVYGIRIVAAVKNRAYKFGAIELTNGDFVDGRIDVLKGSPLEDQLLTLQWVADQFGALSENKNQANHSTDCLIYARRLVAHLFETGTIETDRKKRAPKRQGRAQAGDEEPPDNDYGDLLASASYDDDPWQP